MGVGSENGGGFALLVGGDLIINGNRLAPVKCPMEKIAQEEQGENDFFKRELL